MKTTTVLTFAKILALLGGINYSIEFGAQLTNLIASFINHEWAKHTYQVDLNIFNIREQSTIYYVFGMLLTLSASALKATIWYVLYSLLLKLKFQSPFMMEVERKLEQIAYLMFGVWIVAGFFWKTYIYYLSKETGTQLPIKDNVDEYIFFAGIVYIISQIFKRGIEIQEENQLTI